MTTDMLKHGTSLVADTAGAVEDLAERAKEQATHVKEQATHVVEEARDRIAEHRAPKRHRGRTLLLVAVAGAGLAWAANLARRTGLGRRIEERVIDLTAAGRTDEATLERLASEGLDPVSRGGV